ncbi:MAG: ABC transporter substrate-binding protein [Deltaproteobacteria bacterium]|nr:ABC transporter substrate-binding protein [Deltaproteobacteria bacterium]
MFSRRKFLKGITGAAGSLLYGGQSLPALARTKKTLRLGYLPITDATPLLIAHARGYFTDEGLRVERPIRIRSWSSLMESFLTNKFDVTHMLLPIPIWMRFKKEVPVKVLAWDHTNGSAITVRADTGINGFADLGGKQIAVPYWYSMHNIILQMGLKKAGLTPVIQPQSQPLTKRQTNLFILPPPAMPTGLAGRKIDGYIVAEPFNALAELKINARIMRFTGDIWQNHPCCVVVMKETFLKQDPIFTQKVINAIVRAQLWAKQNPVQTAHILSKQGGGYLPVSEQTLLRVFTKYDLATYGSPVKPTAIRHPGWHSSRIDFHPYPYPSASSFIVRALAETLVEGDHTFLNTLDPEFAAQDLVDDSFVKNAINQVGGLGKFGEINLDTPWEREEIIDL